MLTTNHLSSVPAMTSYHCLESPVLNQYGSHTRFDNQDMSNGLHRILKCDSIPTPYPDRCFVSVLGEKIFSSMTWSVKSLTGLFSRPSEFSRDPITNSSPSIYSGITQAFQAYAKPCFEIRIGQSQTLKGKLGRFNVLDLSLKLGDKILRKNDHVLDLISRELSEKDIGSSFTISRENGDKRVYLSALPKTIQSTVISLLVTGRPESTYDCFRFVYDCIGNTQVESGYELVPLRKLESRLAAGDFVYLGNGNASVHAAVFLGDNLFLSVLGSGGGLSVVEANELMRGYGTDSIYKIHLASYLQELPKMASDNALRYVIEEEDGLKTHFLNGDTFTSFAQRLISREQHEKNGYILKAHQNHIYGAIEIYMHNRQGYLPITIHPDCQKALLNLLNDSPLNSRRFLECIDSTHKTSSESSELPGKVMQHVRHYHSMGDLIVIRNGEDVIAMALHLFNGFVLYEANFEGDSSPFLLVTTIDELLNLKKGTSYGAHGPKNS